MTSKPVQIFLVFAMIIWSVSIAGCSTLMPAPTPTAIATEIAALTKTPVPSATTTSTPEPFPTPYNGPNILFYIGEGYRLFSIYADGSNQREIAQGVSFSISPDKQRLVYRTAYTPGSNMDEVVVMDLTTEKIILRWSIPGYCDGIFMSSYFAWSPDSQKIAFTLTRNDGVDPVPNCELEYDYQNLGIYQIDLMSRKIVHPPLLEEFRDDLHHATVSYSPDGSKLRIGTRKQVFDTATWKQVADEPYYDLLQFGDQAAKIGICGVNLCLYSNKNLILKYFTQYDNFQEGVGDFKLFPNGSAIVYETHQEFQLHLLSLSGESDEIIGANVWGYFITPDNSEIIYYEQDWSIEDARIFVVNSDGSNKRLLTEFPRRRSALNGPLMVLSPTGEKVAFVNHEGIAIMDLNGNNFVQLVKLSDSVPSNNISLGIFAWH